MHARDIRHEIEQLADIGKIPKIIFIPHKSDTISVPTAEEIENILSYQHQQSEILEDEEGALNMAESDSSDKFSHVLSSEKRTDVLGFDRKSAMDKVMEAVETGKTIYNNK